MTARREVWITGVGLLTCLGEGLESVWSHLERGYSPPYDDKSFAPYVVHPLAPMSFDKQIPKKSDQRQMETWQRVGVYTAGLALSDAGIAGKPDLLDHTDMIVDAGGGERDIAVDTAILSGMRKVAEPAAFLNQRLMRDASHAVPGAAAEPVGRQHLAGARCRWLLAHLHGRGRSRRRRRARRPSAHRRRSERTHLGRRLLPRAALGRLVLIRAHDPRCPPSLPAPETLRVRNTTPLAPTRRRSMLSSTNQVPATWFEGDCRDPPPGVAVSDGPARGRRRTFRTSWPAVGSRYVRVHLVSPVTATCGASSAPTRLRSDNRCSLGPAPPCGAAVTCCVSTGPSRDTATAPQPAAGPLHAASRGPHRPLGVEQGRHHVVVVGALVGHAQLTEPALQLGQGGDEGGELGGVTRHRTR